MEKLGDDFRTQAVGTGPFAIEQYTPNQSVTLVANKSYFRGAPKIDRVLIRLSPEWTVYTPPVHLNAGDDASKMQHGLAQRMPWRA